MPHRRQSEWIDTRVAFQVVPGAGQTSLGMSTPSAGGSTDGYTLVRTLIRLAFFPATAPTNDTYLDVGAGIGLATFDAIAAGSVPDVSVVTERPIQDWVWLDRFMVIQDNADILEPARVNLDIRAGRQLGGGNLFFAMLAVVTIGTTVDCVVRGLIRCLYLRP